MHIQSGSYLNGADMLPFLSGISFFATNSRARPVNKAVAKSKVLIPRMIDPFKVSVVPCVAWEAVLRED